ncbi:MAG TPA: hypothetical protein VH143_30945 [Kofleriaceae bacterium]|jgi:hypothetical protein|nr:hypothetical protein [Kofleriaceae bacterium]
MRLALAMLVGLTSCGANKSPCDTIEVHIDDHVVIELPARAEYCVMSPDAASCCRHEGTVCDELAARD